MDVPVSCSTVMCCNQAPGFGTVHGAGNPSTPPIVNEMRSPAAHSRAAAVKVTSPDALRVAPLIGVPFFVSTTVPVASADHVSVDSDPFP